MRSIYFGVLSASLVLIVASVAWGHEPCATEVPPPPPPGPIVIPVMAAWCRNGSSPLIGHPENGYICLEHKGDGPGPVNYAEGKEILYVPAAQGKKVKVTTLNKTIVHFAAPLTTVTKTSKGFLVDFTLYSNTPGHACLLVQVDDLPEVHVHVLSYSWTTRTEDTPTTGGFPLSVDTDNANPDSASGAHFDFGFKFNGIPSEDSLDLPLKTDMLLFVTARVTAHSAGTTGEVESDMEQFTFFPVSWSGIAEPGFDLSGPNKRTLPASKNIQHDSTWSPFLVSSGRDAAIKIGNHHVVSVSVSLACSNAEWGRTWATEIEWTPTYLAVYNPECPKGFNDAAK